MVWLADYEAWGNVNKEIWREVTLEPLQVDKAYLQPIRFQGQHFDEETGLHYNRFRYYDPDMGMFIARDPIGLKGGDNVFQYAPNPTRWVDPLGLHEETIDTSGIEEALSTPLYMHQIRIVAKLAQAISGSKTDEKETDKCTSTISSYAARRLALKTFKPNMIVKGSQPIAKRGNKGWEQFLYRVPGTTNPNNHQLT